MTGGRNPGPALKCAISFFIIGKSLFGAFYKIAAYCLPKSECEVKHPAEV